MTYSVLFVTCPNYKTAYKISEVLLKKKLIACVNMIAVKSKYWSGNKIEKHSEVLMILKTKNALYSEMEKEIKKLHPYKIPEIISFKVTKGNKNYLNWISSVTR